MADPWDVSPALDEQNRNRVYRHRFRIAAGLNNPGVGNRCSYTEAEERWYQTVRVLLADSNVVGSSRRLAWERAARLTEPVVRYERGWLVIRGNRSWVVDSEEEAAAMALRGSGVTRILRIAEYEGASV